ncbi:RDD family protein [Vibrio ostreicida]|uniref:RDD family protein n=1 Tax=Vibrio ostreicida TaxID=526588 RepID=A0ABT8BMW6_9VIBR|nr:RDD family protein [Vibrio ostreicida]MDN3608223.1 RDD family protein [Vibrio ostreicida]NPD09790.1 RDD family protein [Vibrio ostreicida]
MSTPDALPAAGLMRRLGALFYDSLIVIAIEMLAAGIVIAVLHALVAMGAFSATPYLDVSDFLTHHPIWSPIYKLYLAFVWVYFFVFFWTRAGQTLGMRAWKIQIRNPNGTAISTNQAVIRIATSGFGLANITVPFDRQKRGIHDILAKTQVVLLPKVQ